MRALAPLALAIGLTGCAAAPQPPHADAHAHEPAGMPAHTDFRRAMDAGMARMMRDMHLPAASGQPDIDFLAMMIPHHVGAVEMARLELVHGRDPATRRLAEDIIASQSVEIEGMQRRLAALRQGTAQAQRPAGFPALGGLRGP